MRFWLNISAELEADWGGSNAELRLEAHPTRASTERNSHYPSLVLRVNLEDLSYNDLCNLDIYKPEGLGMKAWKDKYSGWRRTLDNAACERRRKLLTHWTKRKNHERTEKQS